jgi:hypothetical protein
MIVYLPANLDLKAHIVRFPPVNVVDFKLDRLAYLLSLLISVPSENKGILENSIGWVPLYSKILERRVRNYKHYFEYAAGLHNKGEDGAKIIEILDSYYPGRSKSYRYDYPYNSLLLINEWEITDRTLLRSINKRLKAVYASVVELYPNLVKWFDPKRLEIDSESAKNYAELLRVRNQKEVDDYVWPLYDTGGAVSKEMFDKPEPSLQYISTLLNINKIERGQFHLSVDTNVRRFHSNITNLKSEIRHFLTYDGKQLVSIDIKNSQPFLSVALFNPEFLTEHIYEVQISMMKDDAEQRMLLDILSEEADEDSGIPANPDTILELPQIFEGGDVTQIAEKPSNQAKRNRDKFHISTVAPDVYEFLTTPQSKVIKKRNKKTENKSNRTSKVHPPSIIPLIMFAKNVNSYINTTSFQDVVQFFESASLGELYDKFAEQMGEKEGYENSDRSTAKKALILALFTNNSFINSADAAPKRLFRDIFPTVYRYFNMFKKLDQSILARLLQSIESWLILDQISTRISSERPDIPLFTVHDSILTTEGNEEYVKNVMEDLIGTYLSIKPTLKVEYLSPDNLPRL